MSSADCSVTPLVIERTFSWPHLLLGELGAHSAARDSHCNAVLFAPSGTHYCRVDRGNMEWDICLTLLHISSSGNWTPDLVIFNPTPCPLGHMLWSTCLAFWGVQKYFWFKGNLGQKYYAPQIWPDWGSNSWPPDHDSTFHVKISANKCRKNDFWIMWIKWSIQVVVYVTKW